MIALGADHAGYLKKKVLLSWLHSQGLETFDVGTNSTESCNYPDFAHRLSDEIAPIGKYPIGILLCGSGLGVSMVANKYDHVRCALCWNKDIAKLARSHNNANVLALPARFLSDEQTVEIVKVFLSEKFLLGRHAERVAAIPPTLSRGR